MQFRSVHEDNNAQTVSTGYPLVIKKLTGSSLQTLHYYENPGILMIVQSVDIEEKQLSLGKKN